MDAAAAADEPRDLATAMGAALARGSADGLEFLDDVVTPLALVLVGGHIGCLRPAGAGLVVGHPLFGRAQYGDSARILNLRIYSTARESIFLKRR